LKAIEVILELKRRRIISKNQSEIDYGVFSLILAGATFLTSLIWILEKRKTRLQEKLNIV
jgi:hypothetical protein